MVCVTFVSNSFLQCLVKKHLTEELRIGKFCSLEAGKIRRLCRHQLCEFVNWLTHLDDFTLRRLIFEADLLQFRNTIMYVRKTDNKKQTQLGRLTWHHPSTICLSWLTVMMPPRRLPSQRELDQGDRLVGCQ